MAALVFFSQGRDMIRGIGPVVYLVFCRCLCVEKGTDFASWKGGHMRLHWMAIWRI